MEKGQENLGAEIVKEFQRLARDRGPTESLWDEIAKRTWPAYSGNFKPGSLQTPGAKRTEELYDSTAAVALGRFGAILDSLLTPRNQTWHRLLANDPVLNKARRVRLWFEEVNTTLFRYRYSPKANFASQNQQNYKMLGAFGTGCLFTDKLQYEPGLRYRAIHLGEVFFDENHQGLVDRAYRYFPLTARQAAQKWGKEKLPEKIRASLESNYDAIFYFIHKVCPRNDYDPGRLDFKGKPWAAYYVAVDGGHLIEEEGFISFPYAVSRYEQAPGECYGRSPAMDVLPAIKTLNEQKKTVLKQGHRALDPILLGHDDGVMSEFSMKPGAYNAGAVTKDGRPLVHALPVGNIAVGKDLMDDERKVINDAFLVTLFQILVESSQMSATEVLERTREKGILLAPTLGRQQAEAQGPMIEREIDLLGMQGLLPPMPPELIEAKGQYRIEYDSPLSRAQRAEEAAGLMRTIETALNVVNVTANPEPLDHFEWDVIVPEIAEIQGVPVRWIRSLDKVQEIRQGRQTQNDMQTAIQAGPAAAAMMKADAMTKKAAGA